MGLGVGVGVGVWISAFHAAAAACFSSVRLTTSPDISPIASGIAAAAEAGPPPPLATQYARALFALQAEKARAVKMIAPPRDNRGTSAG